jgi:hypothetical protein
MTCVRLLSSNRTEEHVFEGEECAHRKKQVKRAIYTHKARSD